jgi:hypothetical protein
VTHRKDRWIVQEGRARGTLDTGVRAIERCLMLPMTRHKSI